MITSTANARVKWIRSLQRKRRARQQEGLFVIEGLRLAREAVAAGVRPQLVMVTQAVETLEPALLHDLGQLQAEVVRVTPEVMSACSSLESPPGLLAVLSVPEPPPPESVDLALIIEGLSDPGNLGTLLRTAWAAGVQLVVLGEGTVDAYNPKVVRGAMGAHFHLPLQGASVKRLPAALQGLAIWLAEARAGLPYDQVDWSGPVALAIGGEAEGPSSELRQRAYGRVHIPMQPQVDSLNAATASAVILFEIRRQRGVG